MTASVRLRRSRVSRAVAGTMATLLLGLSIAAGFHRGDHDDLGWLPSRFHQHDYELRAEADGPSAPLVDHCLACHVSRTLIRLAASGSPLPEAAPAVSASIRVPVDAATDRSLAPYTPRAPPA